MELAEGQGHRLSSYASSSSNKQSPKTPKRSTDKLSTRSSSKDESVSPRHLLSEYSFSSVVNSPQTANNLNHSDCILKCTCISSSNNSLIKSPKYLNGGDNNKSTKVSTTTTTMSAATSTSGGTTTASTSCTTITTTTTTNKVSCDAATSPNRHSQRNSQQNMRLINKNKESSIKQNEVLHISDDKKIISKTGPSPRRLVATRNAATSPNLEIRRQLSPKQHCELLIKSPPSDLTSKLTLEKSNSLGEKKPSRPLRTTRSLSPRPPVRHQHAIMVSDENDIISVKVSPNEDFDDLMNENKCSTTTRRKHKAQSEQTSPNLSDFDTTFSYDICAANKSTGCLVYVPSDPWLKMTDLNAAISPLKHAKKKINNKHFPDTRSLSRGYLPSSLDNDPWVWRKAADDTVIKTSSSINNRQKSPRQELYRQSKSLTTPTNTADFADTSFTEKKSVTSKNKNGHKSLSMSSSSGGGGGSARPKLQRCKSPLIIDDESFLIMNNDNSVGGCICNSIESKQILMSPRKDDGNFVVISGVIGDEETHHHLYHHQQSPPSLPLSSSAAVAPPPNKTFLNVINPNLIQSRHSFSSISKKDDELQLNIRRLSEQIKNTNSNASGAGADFTDYLNQFRNSSSSTSTGTTTEKHCSNSPLNYTQLNPECAVSSRILNSSKNNLPQPPPPPPPNSNNSDSVLETTC